MTRMTGPDFAVMCNLINTHTCMHTYIHTYIYTYNSMFARLGTDYEIRNQWFFAILEAMTTD